MIYYFVFVNRSVMFYSFASGIFLFKFLLGMDSFRFRNSVSKFVIGFPVYILFVVFVFWCCSGYLLKTLVNFEFRRRYVKPRCQKRPNDLIINFILHYSDKSYGLDFLTIPVICGSCINLFSFRTYSIEFVPIPKLPPVVLFFSVSIQFFLPNAIDFLSPLFCFTDNVILRPVLLATGVTKFPLSFAYIIILQLYLEIGLF